MSDPSSSGDRPKPGQSASPCHALGAPSLAVLLLCCGWAIAEARADEPVPSPDPSIQQGSTSVTYPPAEESSKGWLFDLSGLGKDIGATLADHGVYLTGRFQAQGLGEVSGGLAKGAFYEGYIALGADFDMNRIAGIQGGILHVLVGDLQGQAYNNFTGSFYAYDRAYAFSDEFRLNEFSWEQELFDNKVRILAGRVTPATDFDTSDLYCQFIFSFCAAPAAFIFDKSAAAYLTSAWGTAITIKPSQPTYVKVGLYEDEASLSLGNHGGWPGTDWNFSKATGASIPVQIGYQTDLDHVRYPQSFDIGGFWDTSSFADPLLNTAGRARINAGGAPLMHQGRTGVYLQAQQTVYRPNPATDRGVTIFGAANWLTSGEANINHTFILGLWAKGPIPSRPNDTFGFSVDFTGLNHRVTDRIDDQIAKAGGSGTVLPDETAFEVNYGIGLAPGVTFKPFVQYVLHPDQLTVPSPSASLTHSLLVGTTLAIGLNSAFGLPQLPRGGY
jgi:porin